MKYLAAYLARNGSEGFAGTGEMDRARKNTEEEEEREKRFPLIPSKPAKPPSPPATTEPAGDDTTPQFSASRAMHAVVAMYSRLAADGLLASDLPSPLPRAIVAASKAVDAAARRRLAGETTDDGAFLAAADELERAYRDALAPTPHHCAECGCRATVLVETAVGAFCRTCLAGEVRS